MKKNKKNKILSSLFVVLSISGLIALILFFSFLKFAIFTEPDREEFVDCYDDDFDISDPYITKTDFFNTQKEVDDDNNPFLGKEDSSVAIRMYSDFNCDFCNEQEEAIREVIKNYDNLKFIIKHYPSLDTESVSWQSALAEKCAYKQNNFWQYHDLLKMRTSYENYDLINLAKEINLNISDFERCMESDEVFNFLIDDIIDAKTEEINGVPEIFINNKKISNNINKEELIEKINFELEEKTEN